MEIRQGFKFRLKPKYPQFVKMRQFSGCCRFVWNKALALEKENYDETGTRLGYDKLAGLLVGWKKDSETAFLKDAHSQILQQSLKDLDIAYKNFFGKRAEFPKFKKRGFHDSFHYPQGFRLDEENSRWDLVVTAWDTPPPVKASALLCARHFWGKENQNPNAYLLTYGRGVRYRIPLE